jgi:feruloyl esterase
MVPLCRLATTLLLQTAAINAAPAPSSSTARCATLTSLSLEQFNATVVSATYHIANSFNVTDTFNNIHTFNNIPFCEVQAQVSYGTNTSLSFVVWLPEESNYRQRFLTVGNGAFAGTIDTVTMLKQFNAGLGLAVAGGNGGHEAAANTGDGYLPFMHDPDQIRAWIHNGISLFAQAAKQVVSAYYGSAAKRAYYAGCSTGGAQGYALAQYHPNLFDGIYAGSPGFWYSHLMLSILWNMQKTNVGGSCS